MKSHYRAIVIGGGIVGARVLYHLAKLGWRDVLLIERKELTAGSTWHAAAGFHTLNGDPNIAALQKYTVGTLYPTLQAEGLADIGMHLTGGITVASTPERWESVKATWALFKTLGIDAHLMTPAEIAKAVPIADVTDLYGGLFEELEGHMDPSGVTQALVKGARARGADLVLQNRVVELHATADGWSVVTEQGTISAEHVVNAAGLWARRVGHMAGVNLPVVPMSHHYLITEDIPELAGLKDEIPGFTDLEGFTYLQQERNGVLMGVYERNPVHWNVDGAPWDYGTELIPEDIDRIAPELEIGFKRFPALQKVGIRKWVNGAFTFTPDGNPLVGPVPGLRNYWVACGIMAGFSQGGGVGLALAQWMIGGEPDADVFGMDVARYGAYAADDLYLKARTAEFYARRFVLTYPNEQLPAGRPLKTSPVHRELANEGACFGVSYGLEMPLYLAGAGNRFEEKGTLRRSNAFEFVRREALATRNAIGMVDTTGYARYGVRGPKAREFLDKLLAGKLPQPGQVRLAPMLSPKGRLMGDFTVLAWAEDYYWLMASYYLQEWHARWFAEHLPDDGVSLLNLCDGMAGFAISGPRSRDLLAAVTDQDVGPQAFPFMTCRVMQIGAIRVKVARISLTGELGYELNMRASSQPAVREALLAAGRQLGLVETGFNAQDSLRLEKGFGVWSREFTRAYTPAMSGLDRFVAFAKPDFIGRDAVLRERDAGPPAQKLVTLAIDSPGADALGFEPVWDGERRVGFTTSGAYGCTVEKSLALAYVESSVSQAGQPLSVHIVGERRSATAAGGALYDPAGQRMRS